MTQSNKHLLAKMNFTKRYVTHTTKLQLPMMKISSIFWGGCWLIFLDREHYFTLNQKSREVEKQFPFVVDKEGSQFQFLFLSLCLPSVLEFLVCGLLALCLLYVSEQHLLTSVSVPNKDLCSLIFWAVQKTWYRKGHYVYLSIETKFMERSYYSYSSIQRRELETYVSRTQLSSSFIYM